MESADRPHYSGSHWEPFYDSVDEVFRALPERIPKALPCTGFGDTYPGPRKVPESWSSGITACWPNCRQGLIVTLRQSDGQVELLNVSPFSEMGQQVSLEIDTVHVWSSGAEAQVEATWGDMLPSFFDLNFLSSRSWYEAGRRLDFILAGIAFDARPAAVDEIPVGSYSPWASWPGAESGPETGADLKIGLEGSSIFLPVAGWDRGDLSFRGTVRRVTPFGDWLGQSVWRVRVCVVQRDGEDAELDVHVTGRAWAGSEPPKVGQDIEGTLWLQGRLWWWAL